MPPQNCNICSYHQRSPEEKLPVVHRHFSSREMRIMQGVEWSTTNRSFLCPTCFEHHPARPETGLNVCLSTGQLHEFHRPTDPDTICPPDSMHVDWVTIPGATIEDLDYAWSMDYEKCSRPQRVLLVAGNNDLLYGGDFDTVTNRILQLKNTVDENNQFHPEVKNELVVGTLLNPPIMTWFNDNGTHPLNHSNRLEEILRINNWIVEFNASYNKVTPRLHRFRVKHGKHYVNGVQTAYTVHQFSHWKQVDSVRRMKHLTDYWKIRLGAAVIHHFEAEIRQLGVLQNL